MIQDLTQAKTLTIFIVLSLTTQKLQNSIQHVRKHNRDALELTRYLLHKRTTESLGMAINTHEQTHEHTHELKDMCNRLKNV